MRTFFLLLAATVSFAQEKPAVEVKAAEPAKNVAQPPVFEAAVIPVKTLTGDSFDRLVKLLSVFSNSNIRGDKDLRTIVVNGPKDTVAQIRRVVEELDRPGSQAARGKNIEMTLTLLRASPKAAASPVTLPPEMEAVARQLRSTTQYKDVTLWDVIPLRLQEGADLNETLRLPGAAAAGRFATAQINLHPEAVYRKDKEQYVRFTRANLNIQMPVAEPTAFGFSYTDIGLHTAGDFMEGQKTVLGKISGSGEDDAIFAVITLKVLD